MDEEREEGLFIEDENGDLTPNPEYIVEGE